MRGERQLLRLGDYLVGRACRRLPREIRAEQYREWAAELPAILHDAQIRPAPRRAVRMLAYAADTVRATAMTPTRARRRTSRATAAPAPMKDGRDTGVRRLRPGPTWIAAFGGAVLCVAAYPFVPAVHQFTLGPSLSEMILSLVLFLIVFAVMSRVVPRALKVMAMRSGAAGGSWRRPKKPAAKRADCARSTEARFPRPSWRRHVSGRRRVNAEPDRRSGARTGPHACAPDGCRCGR